MSRRLKRFAVALLSPVVLLGGAELALRWSGFEYPPLDPIQIWNRFDDRQIRLGRAMHEYAQRQIWRPRAGAAVPWGGTINARGYRGPVLEAAKRPGVLRIAALGDSSTFGLGVTYEDTYSAQLELLVEGGGQECEVLDSGVIGFTIRQGLERYDQLVRAYDVDVVTEAFGAVNECRQAKQSVSDKDKIALDHSTGGLWTEVGFSLCQESRVLQLIARGVDLVRGVGAEERDRILQERYHENEQGQQAGRLDFPGVRRVSLADFEDCLSELLRRVEGDGARLVLLSMPRQPAIEEQFPVLLEYTRAITDFGARHGLDVVDGRGAFQAALRSGATLEQLFVDPYHPSAEGHGILARELARVLGPRPQTK